MKLKKSAFASLVCITGGCLINQASADAIRNVGAPVILDAFTDANPDIGTGTLSIALGSGNYNLPNSGNGNNAGRGLIIGEGNTLSTPNSHVAGYAMIAGYGNSIRVHGGIVGGYNNRISFDQSSTTNFGKFTSIFGISNIVHPGVQGSYASLVAGSQQRLTGDYSFLSGQENIVSGPNIGSETLNSVAMGATNTIASETAWTIGSGNILTGKGASAYGTGLSAIHRGVIVLGSYNVDPAVTGAGGLDLRTNYFSDSALLVVGNGTEDNARSNALVLRRSGDLEIAGTIYQEGSVVATQSYAASVADTAINNRLSSSMGVTGGLATGDRSFSVGYGSRSEGDFSVSLGQHAVGVGSTSLASGYWTNAKGDNSSTFGIGTTANSFASVAIGAFNAAGPGNRSEWIWSDPLFEVGNGDDVSTNAVSVLKNGKTTLTNRGWILNAILNPSAFDPMAIPESVLGDGEALVVEGHARLKGRVVIENPQGDINPGIYQ